MMVRSRGFSFEMNLDKEVIRVQQFEKHLQDITPDILRAMGVQAVSWAVQDYRSRSDGGTAGGTTWNPITAGAIRSRLAGRTPWQRQTEQLLKLRAEQEPLTEKLRRKMPEGDDPKIKARRGAIARKFMESEDGKKLEKIKKKRRDIRAKRKTTIERELSTARIGVDTGRLVNSLVYGVQELSAIRPPARLANTQGLKPALFTIQGNQIRIGSVMEYAKYFDEKRPIFPVGFLDPNRRKQLDRIIELTTNSAFRRKFGMGGER